MLLVADNATSIGQDRGHANAGRMEQSVLWGRRSWEIAKPVDWWED